MWTKLAELKMGVERGVGIGAEDIHIKIWECLIESGNLYVKENILESVESKVNFESNLEPILVSSV